MGKLLVFEKFNIADIQFSAKFSFIYIVTTSVFEKICSFEHK